MKCAKCDMSYVPELPEDEAAHAEYCDIVVNGPPVGAISDEKIVWENAEDRILLVTDTSSLESRLLAEKLSRTANREMDYDGGIYHHYDSPDDREIHLFLYIRTSRAIGLLIFEKRTSVWSCTWQQESFACVEDPARGPMWSIAFVWVHEHHRHIGIAYRLFIEAKRVLHSGANSIGWYTPFTVAGEAFVRKQYPTSFFVAK